RMSADGRTMLLVTFGAASESDKIAAPATNEAPPMQQVFAEAAPPEQAPDVLAESPSIPPPAPPAIAPGEPQPSLGPAADAPATPAPPERRHPLRFVWTIDEDGRFTLDSEEFIALAGPGTAVALGRPWPDIAGELELDPEHRVAHALATQDTWSGLTISW